MRFLRLSAFFICLDVAFNLSSANPAFASTTSIKPSNVTLACVDEGFGYYQVNGWLVLIFLLLCLLFFYAAVVVIERSLAYLSAKKVSRIYSQRVALALSANQPQEAINISKICSASPLAKAMTEILQLKHSSSQKDFDAEAFQAAARTYITAECEEELDKNLTGLKKAGKAALVLGGVGIGISLLDTFGQLRFVLNYDDFLSVFAGRLTDSFTVFFFSLFVAVPCLWFHKRFSEKAQSLLGNIETGSWQLINRIANLPENNIRRPRKVTQANQDVMSEKTSPAIEQQLFSSIMHQ